MKTKHLLIGAGLLIVGYVIYKNHQSKDEIIPLDEKSKEAMS